MKSLSLLLVYLLLAFMLSQSVMAQAPTDILSSCSESDIDTNANNLIDICDIEGFNAITDDGYGDESAGCHPTCGGYELRNDLDFSEQEAQQPIEYFDATLNGNGHTISNLTIDSTNTYVGLFGEVAGDAEIIGIRLLNVRIVGGGRDDVSSVGALAGLNDGKITDCSIVNQDKNRKVEGDINVGGLVGLNYGLIENSSMAGAVEGSDSVGGLVGNNTGTIVNSHAIRSVKGDMQIGGLVGSNDGGGTIVNSYAASNVKGNIAGGLAGRNAGRVANSYAVGNVIATKATHQIGGLVGVNVGSGAIENSYATGDVASEVVESEESAAAGGLVGHIFGGTIRHSYAIGDVADDEDRDVGSLVGLVSGGNIIRSYAKDDIGLVGFSSSEESIIASFTFSKSVLQTPVAPGTTSTEVYYLWPTDNWNFGTNKQYPELKYTRGFNEEMPACGEMPKCGDSLAGPQANLEIYVQLRVFLEGALPGSASQVSNLPQSAGKSFHDCPTCPEMIVIPAGKFTMGSPDDEKGRMSDEGPWHEVTIPKAFAVGKYEVTRGQFAEFAASTSTITRRQDSGFTQTDNHPVVNVNWNEAQAYIAWLSEKTGQEYRLLSEAEWEYVARAGTTTRYSFGSTTPTSTQARYWSDECGPKVVSNSPCWGTVAVGSYPANAFGLHDVHGNVYEWVEDCWHGNYDGAPADGSVWTSDCNGDNLRVLRGGAWYSFLPRFVRSASRDGTAVTRTNYGIGFRIARTLSRN